MVGPGEVQVSFRPDWNNVEMGVRHLEPGDHQTHSDGGERHLLGTTDALGDHHQVRCQVGVEVEPVVDLQARHHQGVSRTKGSDGQERHSLFVGMNEATG